MDNIFRLFNLQGQLGLLLIIGFFLSKIQMIDSKGRTLLTDLLINLILPCNIIHSFCISFNMEVLRSTFAMLVASTFVQICSILISKWCFNSFKHSKRAVLQYGTVCSNAGFLGNPIAEGIFGSSGLLLASVFLIPQRFVMWSLGIGYFLTDDLERTPEQKAAHRKDVLKKIMTHPCIIAVFIGMSIMLLQIPLPSFLSSTLKSISNCTTPFSMILVGAIMGSCKLQNPLSKDVLYYCFIRFIVIPIIILLTCRVLKLTSLVTGVAVVLSAMPMGGTTGILAEKYGADSTFAAKCITVSTIISLITTPLWCLVV